MDSLRHNAIDVTVVITAITRAYIPNGFVDFSAQQRSDCESHDERDDERD
ncbi:MAG: hypothetical protein QMC74_07625 [Myxococcota bacterium]|jgi:hypothetical protein